MPGIVQRRYPVSSPRVFAIALIACLLSAGANAQLTQQGTKEVGTGYTGTNVRQGSSTALSADGNTAIEGAYADNSLTGGAWIFTRSGATWSQQGGELVGSDHVSDDQEGTAVAISGDGNTALLGGPGHGNSGATYVFTRSGTSWSQQAELIGTGITGTFASQGNGLALSSNGNIAAIGGPDDGSGSGAVWIFTRSGASWTQQAKITGAPANAQLGFSVALSADGSTLIAGAPTNTGGPGSVWVFTQSGGIWTLQAGPLVGGSGSAGATQGTFVAVSSDGNTLAEGGPGDSTNKGATWVFTRSGTSWSQQAKLVGTTSSTSVQQGTAVGLSGDGNTLITGGPEDGATTIGAAFMFTRSGTSWTELGGKLIGSGASSGSAQGTGVALSASGGTAIVGGNNDNSGLGAVWFYAGNALTVAVTGNGTVTSADGGINCNSSTCSSTYLPGAQATLTATPAVGAVFSGWSGAGCSGTGTCVVTMSAAQNVTATFMALPNFTLTVTPAGSGGGLVTSSPSGINCGATCSAQFVSGTAVTLTASASAGSSFSGWSGGGCSGTGTCVVTMNAAQNVTASFTQIPSFMLSVVSAGNGTGTVTSSPSGINCGATCNASYQTGTQVTLSAAAASGSTFAGWSGGGCSGVATCAVTLAANTSVTASFVQNTAGNLTLVAAVLPLSRSVQVGATPTAFATMINAGPDNASNCTIAPATSIPASFLFQTTDPTTNALTGTLNTPANIAAGAGQSFVIAFTPTAAFAPTNVAFVFTCTNAPSPVASLIGINTLNLSASTTPVPDIVALAASGDPGYVDIPGATGTGDFAVATVNLGVDATITAGANTGMANLPVTLLVCQTNPTSGACLAAPSATASTDIPPNATPTFAIFVAGMSAVANSPGVNRVFVTFTDAGGVLRGETSVAVRTQ
jgi:hypothetical protein